jgi:hypothetical protein
MKHPATIILVYALCTAGAWLFGIYFGAKWERETAPLVANGVLCVCQENK